MRIDITAANLGTSQESFEIQLQDETDGKVADSVGVTVEAGQILALTLQWDTSGASPVVHDLRAIADLVTDENPANNALSPALPIAVILAEIFFGDGNSGELPAASFGAGLIPPDTSTASIPGTEKCSSATRTGRPAYLYLKTSSSCSRKPPLPTSVSATPLS